MTPMILVAADGTPAGAGALRLALRLAERENARVEVLAVHDPAALRIARADDPANSVRPPSAELAVRSLRERIRVQLQQIGAGVEDWPLTVRVGGVARMIASHAVERGAGRVLLGLNQADAAQRWLAREMLLDLIRRLNVPVLAVPPGHAELPRCVIVAVDFSKYSLEIAREALEDLEPGAQLHLVNVVPPGRQLKAHPIGQSHPDRLATERQLTELASELELPGIVAVETHFLRGDPADEILRLADEVGAELIAAGSHGASYPGQAVTGDVYGKLVHAASCSLLIGPPRGMRLPMQGAFEGELALQPIVA
jgi:nucleotide-binding universal stress UspA family protein